MPSPEPPKKRLLKPRPPPESTNRFAWGLIRIKSVMSEQAKELNDNKERAAASHREDCNAFDFALHVLQFRFTSALSKQMDITSTAADKLDIVAKFLQLQSNKYSDTIKSVERERDSAMIALSSLKEQTSVIGANSLSWEQMYQTVTLMKEGSRDAIDAKDKKIWIEKDAALTQARLQADIILLKQQLAARDEQIAAQGHIIEAGRRLENELCGHNDSLQALANIAEDGKKMRDENVALLDYVNEQRNSLTKIATDVQLVKNIVFKLQEDVIGVQKDIPDVQKDLYFARNEETNVQTTICPSHLADIDHNHDRCINFQEGFFQQAHDNDHRIECKRPREESSLLWQSKRQRATDEGNEPMPDLGLSPNTRPYLMDPLDISILPLTSWTRTLISHYNYVTTKAE